MGANTVQLADVIAGLVYAILLDTVLTIARHKGFDFFVLGLSSRTSSAKI